MPITKDFKIVITPEDIGYHFSRSDSYEQAEILYWIASELQHVHSKDYSPYAVNFCFQADAISREKVWKTFPYKKEQLVNVLEDLLEHLKH